MVQKLLFTTLFSFFASSLFSLSPALAGNKDESLEGKSYEEQSIRLLRENEYHVSFLRSPRVSESIFIMRLSHPDIASGCADLKRITSAKDQKDYNFRPSGIAGKVVAGTFEVLINQPVLVHSDEAPRYTYYDCVIKHNKSYVDIKMDRDRLISKNIEKIGFKKIRNTKKASYDIDFGDYDIDVNKNRFIFKDRTPNGEVWLTLWFYPKNTIVLHAPQAQNGLDVKKQIREFGVSKGLVEMENILDGYTLPVEATNYVFFNDPKGLYVNEFRSKEGAADDSMDQPTQINNFETGTITAYKTYRGPKGPQDEPYSLTVYAKLPPVQELHKY